MLKKCQKAKKLQKDQKVQQQKSAKNSREGKLQKYTANLKKWQKFKEAQKKKCQNKVVKKFKKVSVDQKRPPKYSSKKS